MEWYRDSVWQFIGAIISLIAIFVSYNIFKRQGKQKKISFEIISNSPLVNVNDEVKSKMQILFDRKPVKDVRLLIVKIINTGNESIVKSDYETPINLEFNKNSEILEFGVIDVSPSSMNVDVSNTKETISIQPLLLNPGDSITIKTLLTNLDSGIDVSCRIAGVKEISRLGSDNSSLPFRDDLIFIYIFTILGSFACTISAFAIIFTEDLFMRIVVLVSSILILILMLVYIFNVLLRIKKMQR